MWIAYPVVVFDTTFKEVWERSSEDFFRAAPPISRPFSVYGRPGRKWTTTYVLSRHDEPVSSGVLYVLKGVGAVAILKFDDSAPRTLARPNHNSTGILLNSLGLAANANLVTETVVFSNSVKSSDSFRFPVSNSRADEFTVDEFYPRFIATLAIERMMLDLAMESLNSRRLSTQRARQLAANIRFWISQPTIESDVHRQQFQLLRERLGSEARTAEILDALDLIQKRGNISFLSGSATTAGLLTLIDSESLAIARGWPWILTSFAVGVLVWGIVRGWRR